MEGLVENVKRGNTDFTKDLGLPGLDEGNFGRLNLTCCLEV
jgi:hypothetical protein